MSKAVVFYFSGTGNTHHIAKTIAEQLTQKGLETKSVSIESINSRDVPSLIKNTDIIGFGYPIYGSDIPEPMKRFIEKFPKQPNEKRTFIFCTQLIFSGDGSFVYKNELMEKNLTITQTAHINMPNNISMFPMILRIPSEAGIAKIVARGEKKARRFADAVLENKRVLKGKHSHWLGIMQRGPYRKMYDRFTDMVGVDKDICTQCNRCVRLCPVGNIRLKDGFPDFKGECVQCLRCYSFCPVAAITVSGKLQNPKFSIYHGPVKRFQPEHLKKNK